jgi:hypothetical protein
MIVKASGEKKMLAEKRLEEAKKLIIYGRWFQLPEEATRDEKALKELYHEPQRYRDEVIEIILSLLDS